MEMSAAWDQGNIEQESPAKQKRNIRMWSYLIVGTLFYVYLKIHLGA